MVGVSHCFCFGLVVFPVDSASGVLVVWVTVGGGF
nr:MAG TPA: hypothetical protein [Caudoviricetes sp.]